VSLAEHLLTNLKQNVASLELEPAGGGCFEVTVDGDLIYSKLATGEFPDEADIQAAVGARV
jgi:selenoprotein W-related protein